MIKPEDILSLEYLKKTEYTGSHQGMRYRLEKKEDDGEKKLYVSVWPEPFNFSRLRRSRSSMQYLNFRVTASRMPLPG